METSKYLIKCNGCSNHEFTNGVNVSKDKFHEVTNCPTCHKARTFRCLKCGRNVKIVTVRN